MLIKCQAIEQDRRHSNSKEFSRLDLDPSLVDRILELVRDSTPGERKVLFQILCSVADTN